jgi:hypothetical protein
VEIILTDKEKAAKSWLELDDASLGKAVKSSAFAMQFYSEDKKIIAFYAAAGVLVNIAVNCNADFMNVGINEFTLKDVPLGDWQVVVRKRIPWYVRFWRTIIGKRWSHETNSPFGEKE